MKKFKVTIVRSFTYVVDVEASSAESAEQKAKHLSDRQIAKRGGSINCTDLHVETEEANES